LLDARQGLLDATGKGFSLAAVAGLEREAVALTAVRANDSVGLVPLLQGRQRSPPGQGSLTSMSGKHFPSKAMGKRKRTQGDLP
jgi:hypothetical protein